MGPKNYGYLYPSKPAKKGASIQSIGEMQRQIACGIYEGIDSNSELVSVIDKKNTANVMMGGGHRKSDNNQTVN